MIAYFKHLWRWHNDPRYQFDLSLDWVMQTPGAAELVDKYGRDESSLQYRILMQQVFAFGCPAEL